MDILHLFIHSSVDGCLNISAIIISAAVTVLHINSVYGHMLLSFFPLCLTFMFTDLALRFIGSSMIFTGMWDLQNIAYEALVVSLWDLVP